VSKELTLKQIIKDRETQLIEKSPEAVKIVYNYSHLKFFGEHPPKIFNRQEWGTLEKLLWTILYKENLIKNVDFYTKQLNKNKLLHLVPYIKYAKENNINIETLKLTEFEAFIIKNLYKDVTVEIVDFEEFENEPHLYSIFKKVKENKYSIEKEEILRAVEEVDELLKMIIIKIAIVFISLKELYQNNSKFKPFDIVEDTLNSKSNIGVVKINSFGEIIVVKGKNKEFPISPYSEELRVIGHIYQENLSQVDKVPKLRVELTKRRKIITNASEVEFKENKVVFSVNEIPILELDFDVFVSVEKD